MPSTSWIWLRRLCVLHQAGASSSVPLAVPRLIRRRRIARPAYLRRTASTPEQDYPEQVCDEFPLLSAGSALVFRTSRFRPPPSARSTKAAGRWNSSSRRIKQHLGIKSIAVLRHVGERGEDADLDCRLGLRSWSRSASTAPRSTLCYRSPSSRKCPYIKHLREQNLQRANNQPIEFIRFLTGRDSKEQRARRATCRSRSNRRCRRPRTCRYRHYRRPRTSRVEFPAPAQPTG